MAYLATRELKEVSYGKNFVYKGAMHFWITEDEYIYVMVDNRYFRFSGVSCTESTSFVREAWGSNNKYYNEIGNFIVFKLKEGGEDVMYYIATQQKSHRPILIYKESMTLRDICFAPKRLELGVHTGMIGEIDRSSYAIAENKSRLLERGMPKSDYSKKAMALLKKIQKDTVLPQTLKEVDELYINIPSDSSYEKYTKDYYIENLNKIVKTQSNAEIYYSKILDVINGEFNSAREFLEK